MATAHVASINEEGKETPMEAQPQVAQSTPAPAPAPEAAPAPAPEPTPAPAELPKTASPYPLVGLAGLLSLVAFLVLRTVRAS
jgi:hypothetical protein